MLKLPLGQPVSALNAAISARTVQSLQLRLARNRGGFRFGWRRRGAMVACLAALATGFGSKAWILRKAALLIRHALTAFTTGLRRQLAILRVTTPGARNALT